MCLLCRINNNVLRILLVSRHLRRNIGLFVEPVIVLSRTGLSVYLSSCFLLSHTSTYQDCVRKTSLMCCLERRNNRTVLGTSFLNRLLDTRQLLQDCSWDPTSLLRHLEQKQQDYPQTSFHLSYSVHTWEKFLLHITADSQNSLASKKNCLSW